MRGKLGERVAVGLGDWAPALGEILDVKFGQTVWRNFLLGRTNVVAALESVRVERMDQTQLQPFKPAGNGEQRASAAVDVN